MGGAGPDMFYREPEPKKKSGAGAEEKWLCSKKFKKAPYYTTYNLPVFIVI